MGISVHTNTSHTPSPITPYQVWGQFHTHTSLTFHWSTQSTFTPQTYITTHTQYFLRLVRMTNPLLKWQSRRKLCRSWSKSRYNSLERPRTNAPENPTKTIVDADLWAKRSNGMVCGRHIRDNKNGKPVNFTFSKIWWVSKVSLLSSRNDCVARRNRFSVPFILVPGP